MYHCVPIKTVGIFDYVLFQGIVTRDTFWDRKVLKLVQEQLGGRVHTIACGAAPINPEVKVQFCFSCTYSSCCGNLKERRLSTKANLPDLDLQI